MATEVVFSVVLELLEKHGWTLARIRGRRRIFTKPGEWPMISVPVHRGKVKAVYVRKIEKICRGEENEAR